MIFRLDFYPLSFSPKGERFLAPSPLGEGREGGNLILNSFIVQGTKTQVFKNFKVIIFRCLENR
jgi:hypothetical protein